MFNCYLAIPAWVLVLQIHCSALEYHACINLISCNIVQIDCEELLILILIEVPFNLRYIQSYFFTTLLEKNWAISHCQFSLILELEDVLFVDTALLVRLLWFLDNCVYCHVRLYKICIDNYCSRCDIRRVKCLFRPITADLRLFHFDLEFYCIWLFWVRFT